MSVCEYSKDSFLLLWLNLWLVKCSVMPLEFNVAETNP